jgi:hypothetical protein
MAGTWDTVGGPVVTCLTPFPSWAPGTTARPRPRGQ